MAPQYFPTVGMPSDLAGKKNLNTASTELKRSILSSTIFCRRAAASELPSCCAAPPASRNWYSAVRESSGHERYILRSRKLVSRRRSWWTFSSCFSRAGRSKGSAAETPSKQVKTAKCEVGAGGFWDGLSGGPSLGLSVGFGSGSALSSGGLVRTPLGGGAGGFLYKG